MFSTTIFETFLMIGTAERDMIQNVWWDSCKVKWSEGLSNRVSIIIRWYKIIRISLLLSYYFGSILHNCIYGCTICMLVFNFVNYVFLFLCMFRSRYCFIVLFCVFLLCKSVLYYCHRLSTQMQLTNISYHKIPLIIVQY